MTVVISFVSIILEVRQTNVSPGAFRASSADWIQMGYMYDRSLDGGNGEVKETDLPLDGSSVHVTQFDRDSNTRHSWDTDGSDADSRDNFHFTDQNVGKHDPNRHG